jgi:hypothetical protein
LERDEPPPRGNPRKAVVDPAPVGRPAREPSIEFDRLAGFMIAIKDAMQNWRDNAQARLPGFRDRIIHIKLARGEGGLNLAMDADKIEELTERGRYAGEQLVELFSGTEEQPERTERWNVHRFARYRTTMSLLERYLRAYNRGYQSPTDPVTISYEEQIADGENAAHYRFRDGNLRAFAQATTADYLRLVEVWEGMRETVCQDPPEPGPERTLDDKRVPRPPSTLRAVPPV